MPIDLDFPLSAYIHNKAFVKLGTAYITIINFLKKIGLVFKIMVVVFNILTGSKFYDYVSWIHNQYI